MAKLKYDKGKLRIFERNLRDLSPAMRAIAGVLLDATERAFDNEIDPWTNRKWKDLAESTKQQRERIGRWPGRILEQTGALAASHQIGWDSRRAWIGTNLEYAEYHNMGAGVPMRRTIGISPKDAHRIELLLKNSIK